MKNSAKYLKFLANMLFAALIIFAICFIGPKVIRFFMPFVIGWIIALIANPLVRMLEKRMKIVRKHSSVIIIISVLALVVGLIYLVIAQVGGQVYLLITQLPDLYVDISREFQIAAENLRGFYERLPDGIQENVSSAITSITESLGSYISAIGAPTMNMAGNIAKNIPTVLINIIFTILSAYFFIADRERILEKGREIVPESIQEKWRLISDNFKKVIGGYFIAQFKIMGVVAVILFIGFLILQINFSVLLAILIALLDALPFFGTGTALIPWAIFKILSGDMTTAIGLVALYGITQLVRQVIQPKIVGDTIGLNPLAALIFMYIGYKVSSVIGMILAIPIGVIILNLFQSGAFDDFFLNFKMIAEEFNRFRKL